MEHKNGKVFVHNQVHQASPFCSVLLPKKLSLDEYREFISQQLPFHTQSINTENSCMFYFPPQAELWQRSHFDLEKLRNRKVNHVNECLYRKLDSGIFQRIEGKTVRTCETIGDYLQGPTVEHNYDVQEFIGHNVDIVATVTSKFESVETAAIVDENQFNLSSEPTRNWFHSFSLAHLECPSTTYRSPIQMEGITEPRSYFGMPTTASPLQIDAHGLSSAIYHLHGATKIWLTIPSGQKLNFESLVETKMPDLLKPSVLRCDRKLTSLKLLFTPRKLEEWGVKYNIIFQNPGDFLMLKSYTYYQAFNIGHNVTQSVHFCDDRYFFQNINCCKCIPKSHGDPNPFEILNMKLNWMDYIENSINWTDRFEQVLKSRNPVSSFSTSLTGTFLDTVPTPSGSNAGRSKPTKRKAITSSPVASANKTVPCKFEGCTNLFQFESYMLKHYRSFHQKATRVDCDQCGVECYNSLSLKRHKTEQGCQDSSVNHNN